MKAIAARIQNLIDAFEDALDVFPEDEPIPYEIEGAPGG